MKKLLLLLILLLLIILPSLAFACPARVVSVADGDTITIEPLGGGDRVNIRLWGVDCPESNQPIGFTATEFTKNLVLFKIVVLDVKDKDQYGRTVAIVSTERGKSLQESLLQEGLAWVYPQYCKDTKICNDWKNIEKEARANKKGIWKDANPTEPWKWRKKK